MATIWICSSACLVWSSRPLVVRTAGRWLVERGWLDLAAHESLYFAYGRLFFVVYLGIIAAVWVLRAAQARDAAATRAAGRIPVRLLIGSLAVACFGNVASYGVGVISELAWSWGFALEVLSWPGVIVGSIWYGISMIRHKTAPAWVAALTILGGLLIPAAFLDQWIVTYMPNAQIVPLALIWAVIATWAAVRAPRTPRHAIAA